MNELRIVYRDAVERVAAIAASVDEASGKRAVPATPAWTVHDLLAHLAGSANDAINGRMDGAPGRAWTNRQVVERRTATTAELGEELTRFGGELAQTHLDGNRPNPGWDLLIHEQDLREALGLDRAPSETVELLLPQVVAFLSKEPALQGFDVQTTENLWTIGTPISVVSLNGDDYELLRILFSRRTTEQIARVSDGLALLEGATFFGPRTE